MSENLRRYQQAVYAFDAVVRRVPDGAFDDQSPCEDWTAREVVGHVIWGAKALAAGVAGEGPPSPAPEAEVAGNDPVGAWSDVLDAVLVALDQPGALQTVADSPMGKMSIDDIIGIFYSDPVMHAWDLAQAVGVEHGIRDDLADSARVQWENAGDMLRRPGALGPAQPVPDSADAAARMAACGGREVS